MIHTSISHRYTSIHVHFKNGCTTLIPVPFASAASPRSVVLQGQQPQRREAQLCFGLRLQLQLKLLHLAVMMKSSR